MSINKLINLGYERNKRQCIKACFPTLIIGDKVDTEKLIEAGRFSLENTLNRNVKEIEEFATTLKKIEEKIRKNKLTSSFLKKSLKTNYNFLKKSIRDYYELKEKYEKEGFILKGYDELVSEIINWIT